MTTEIYVPIARDLGSALDPHGKTIYYVGNGIETVQLHPIEYVVWKEAIRMVSIEEWRKDLSERIKPKTKVEFKLIEQRLLFKNLLHSFDFKNEDSAELTNIYVIRNAFAYGELMDTWVIAPHDNKTKLKMSKEEYEVWVEASSYKNLLEIIISVGAKHGYTMQEATQVVSKLARQFIRTELWTAEYILEGDL